MRILAQLLAEVASSIYATGHYPYHELWLYSTKCELTEREGCEEWSGGGGRRRRARALSNPSVVTPLDAHSHLRTNNTIDYKYAKSILVFVKSTLVNVKSAVVYINILVINCLKHCHIMSKILSIISDSTLRSFKSSNRLKCLTFVITMLPCHLDL